ncbi:MAG: ester cyclase [Aristaeellaceae bacterium]
MSNTELVSRFFQEGYENRNYAWVMTCLAEDYLDHSPAGARGNAQAVGILKLVAEQFSQPSVRILHIFADHDMVAARIAFEGTHTGEWMGIPATGKRICFEALEHFRVEGGRIVESWGCWPDKAIEDMLR